jgi:hypothetical protein
MTRPLPTASKFRTFREIWRALIPGNFHAGDGEVIQYVQGWVEDAFAETARQTASLMFPSVAPSDALPLIGADRGIPRGFAEPEASYRERLREWRYPRGHRIRGNAVGLLEQIAAVFGGAVEAQTIDARGTRYTWGADGATTVERGVTWDWDGEALEPNWARFWIVIAPAGVTPLPTWDQLEAEGSSWDELEASGMCWAGQGIHYGQLQAVKRLADVGRLSWTPAGRRPVYCVVQREGEAYPTPAGDWQDWANRPQDTYAFFPLHASLS